MIDKTKSYTRKLSWISDSASFFLPALPCSFSFLQWMLIFSSETTREESTEIFLRQGSNYFLGFLCFSCMQRRSCLRHRFEFEWSNDIQILRVPLVRDWERCPVLSQERVVNFVFFPFYNYLFIFVWPSSMYVLVIAWYELADKTCSTTIMYLQIFELKIT